MHRVLCLLLLLATVALWSSHCTVSATPPPSSSLSPNLLTVNNKTLHYFNLSRPEGEREFYVYLYDGYTAASPSPLAVYYHGFGGGYVQGLQLNMTDAADRHHYILALPHGTPSTEGGAIGWNGGRCCLFPNGSRPEVDDVAFTAAMLKTIQQAFTVDAERVYAMGWSNGGFMSERLGCEAAPLFAGIAADASAVIIGENNSTGLQLCDRHFRNASINYLHFHGLNDPTVPWTGGGNNHEQLPSALEDFSRWTRRNGCNARMEQTFNEQETAENTHLVTFSNLVWTDCRDGTEMELMTARNGVHSWWTFEQGGFNTTESVELQRPA